MTNRVSDGIDVTSVKLRIWRWWRVAISQLDDGLSLTVIPYDGRLGSGSGNVLGRRNDRHSAAELFRVDFRSNAIIDAATAEEQELAKGRAKLAIEAGVDDGVEKRVCVAEPKQQRVKPVRYARFRFVAKRTHQSDNEERQPAQREGAHDDAQRFRRLTFSRRRCANGA